MDNRRLAELEKKWLDGSITEQEAQEYSNWYNLGQNDPVEIPSDIAGSKEEHQLKMLQSIMAKLEQDIPVQQPVEPVRPLIPRRVLAVAATILLMLGIGAVWYFNSRPTDEATSIVQYDKKPGQSGLVITLHDGRELLVDSIPNGLIAEENGIQIIKRNGVIYYEGNSNAVVNHTASTQRGRKYQLVLPDGSKVWLNAASKLTYPNEFSGDDRQVQLEGEAYFEVVSNSKKPFTVRAGGQEVRVLGTHFNVNNYTDENHITTTLLEGKVEVKTNGDALMLAPNQQAISANHGGAIAVSKVDAAASIGWMKGEFNFNNANLRTILNQIARWYDIDVKILPGVNQNQVFYGNTSMNQNLSEVLKVLELSGIHMKLEENTLIVKP